MVDRGKKTLVVGLALLAAAGVLAYWLQSGEPGPLWRPASRPFDPQRCARGECEEALRFPAAKGEMVTLIVDPAVDDETAQWSDCLASVARCVESHPGNDEAEALRDCVRDSACPERCRERFADAADGVQDAEALWTLYERQFVNEGGVCVPGG